MSWVVVGVTAAGALGGAAKANNQNRARKAQNEAQAAQTRYSTWSGMGPGQVDTNYDDPMLGALSGGMGGLGAAQGMGGAEGIKGMFGKASPNSVQGPMQSAANLGNPQLQYSSWNFGGPSPTGGMMTAPQGVPTYKFDY